ncbi:MAG: LysM peptidoglycan-binding domain-containing protein [Planctomycetes bacterium]|nr:LysM peptidoglycan-binding domain-containing protein [Planctomycetota bacterium]
MSIEKTASLIGVGIVMILLGIAIFTREDRARPDMEGAGAVRDLADGAPGRSLIEDGRGRPREWRIADGNIVATDPQSDADGGRRTDADRDSVSDGPRQVKVRPYDSFWKIAERELGDGRRYRELVAANPGIDPASIKPGDLIMIPAPVVERGRGRNDEVASGRRHRVASHETLSHIARHYYRKSTAWPRILDANKDQLSRPEDLRSGMVLVIPEGP